MLRGPEINSHRVREIAVPRHDRKCDARPPVLVTHGSNRCVSIARMAAPTALCPLQHPASARDLTSLL